jgi:hypothetical protein
MVFWFPAAFRNPCQFRFAERFSHNPAAIMGRSARPVNGAARSVRPCGPPVLVLSAPGPFRSAGLYSTAIARKNDGVSPRAPLGVSAMR